MKYRNIDLSAYGRSFVLLARFPQVMVGPFLAGIVQYALLTSLASAGGPTGLDTISAIIYQYLGLLITAIGFALALIIADEAWRRDRAPLSQAWEDVSRKIGNIFFAAIGVQFILYVAALVGGLLGGFVATALGLVAYFFLVYVLPAAAIGGLPGGAPAIETSIARARANPIPTLLLAILSYVVMKIVPGEIVMSIFRLIFATPLFDNAFVSGVLIAAIAAVPTGYLAFVVAKVYADLSYGRRW
jgi:hypothetical protein